MKIMKFGGSSVADADRISRVLDIVAAAHASERVCAVFSAMRGVTDMLLDASREAAAGYEGFVDRARAVRDKHLVTAAALCEDDAGLIAQIETVCDELEELLHGVHLVRECTPRTLDLIVGFGERLNCTIIAASMARRGLASRYVDAREIIRTDDTHGSAAVDFARSYDLIAANLDGDDLPVVTGFIAATTDGVTTTLGRNGSDYTASIVGAGVQASAIEIWTDVDGVYSADPRFVADAFVLPEISYQEAMELSYFGAKVIHPYTMVPAVEKSISLWIKNTLNPEATGTLISGHTSSQSESITGIASIENVALVNVEGGGMVGLPGIAGRIFSALAAARINIVMISQASSEHSICFIIPEGDAGRATRALEIELDRELQQKKIQRVAVERDLEIVAVIGENMRGKPGISGKVFQSLGDASINVLAIAQGSSEMNISFVIYRHHRERTLNAVHAAFFGGDS
ncbi:MAG TPA: aspartate kinase [Spirochaetia bacterium]|nr:aspartate kinase [Spirochaetia bacterium]